MTNRIIKFRAWDSITEKVIYDYSFSVIRGTPIGESNYTLMQFTGLLDKNGKEIYEGDIVKLYDHKGKLLDTKEVTFTDCCFQIPAIEEQIEIIGNIYENPELLSSNKE